MPVPHRPTENVSGHACAAFLDVVWLEPAQTLYGGLLIADARTRPLEFVHASLGIDDGALWPPGAALEEGTAAMARALFSACRLEPDLLICRHSLGTAEFCRYELGPTVPFLRLAPAHGDVPDELAWINDAPTSDMPGASLFEALKLAGLFAEPLDRVAIGLREVYPDAPWPTHSSDRSEG